MKLKSDSSVERVFKRYPQHVKPRMMKLRKLVLDAAADINGLTELEETLKWGEPSYLTKHGSTIRMDWKAKTPDQFAMYFKCTSRLVPTFREIYKEQFRFEGNRAIIFNFQDKVPEVELKHCIMMALTYHKIKHLPLLGAQIALS